MKEMIRRPALLLLIAGLTALALACAESRPAPPEATITLTEPTPSPTPFLSPTATPTPALAPATPTPGPRRVSLDQLAGDAQVPPLPFPFAEPEPDPALEALIVETLGEDLPSYSVVVHHLGDGRSAAVNDGQVYYGASLFKLEVLLETYRQRDAGEVDFAQELVLEKEHVEYDLGTLRFLGLQEGDIITVADAVRAMIMVSDTATAVMVQDLVGPARIEQMLRSLGLRDTYYRTDLPTSARDMATLLKAVAAGDGVSEESRLEMLSLLLRESNRSGIPSGVPPGTAVAHKTGNWTNATHDVALVWGPGGPYLIAVLSDQPWRWPPIVALSQAVYDYFAENP